MNLVVEVDGMEDVIEWAGSVEGQIHWTTDEKEGVCAVAFEFGGGLEGQSTSISGNMGGTVCGVQFSRGFLISGAAAS